jgi:hypothetical protein
MCLVGCTEAEEFIETILHAQKKTQLIHLIEQSLLTSYLSTQSIAHKNALVKKKTALPQRLSLISVETSIYI